MTSSRPGLGTQLRHLIDLLDGGVSEAHEYNAFGYRPRYTPVMRALADGVPKTIGQIAAEAGMTHPATTQTIALMATPELVKNGADRADARRRVVSLAAEGRAVLPRLQAAWSATKRAAEGLDDELTHSLSDAVAEAIAALERRSFGQRITEALAQGRTSTTSHRSDE